MNRFLTQKRNVGFLLLTFVLMSLFSWFVITVSPDTILNQIFFYIILFGIFFSLFHFLFANSKTAVICSGGVGIYFFLRFLHLRHPIYGIILLLCCMAALRFAKQKKRETKNE